MRWRASCCVISLLTRSCICRIDQSHGAFFEFDSFCHSWQILYIIFYILPPEEGQIIYFYIFLKRQFVVTKSYILASRAGRLLTDDP